MDKAIVVSGLLVVAHVVWHALPLLLGAYVFDRRMKKLCGIKHRSNASRSSAKNVKG